MTALVFHALICLLLKQHCLPVGRGGGRGGGRIRVDYQAPFSQIVCLKTSSLEKRGVQREEQRFLKFFFKFFLKNLFNISFSMVRGQVMFHMLTVIVILSFLCHFHSNSAF